MKKILLLILAILFIQQDVAKNKETKKEEMQM